MSEDRTQRAGPSPTDDTCVTGAFPAQTWVGTDLPAMSEIHSTAVRRWWRLPARALAGSPGRMPSSWSLLVWAVVAGLLGYATTSWLCERADAAARSSVARSYVGRDRWQPLPDVAAPPRRASRAAPKVVANEPPLAAKSPRADAQTSPWSSPAARQRPRRKGSRLNRAKKRASTRSATERAAASASARAASSRSAAVVDLRRAPVELLGWKPTVALDPRQGVVSSGASTDTAPLVGDAATRDDRVAEPHRRRPAEPVAPVHHAHKLSIEALEVRGGVPVSEVRRGLARLARRYQRCAEQPEVLAAPYCACGTWEVSAELDETGRARTARVRGPAIAGLMQCIKTATERLAVSAPDTGTIQAKWMVRFSE